ncbi:MAG TPA: hypothetical protein VK427_13850 [Kofleriaceae bacterium]|nr:hypothetical protein [Kofleriaceae bacterium]
MRKLPLSVTISAAIHLAVVALVGAGGFGTRPERAAPPAATPIEVVSIPAATPPVPAPPLDVDVVVLDEPKRPAVRTKVAPTARARAGTVATSEPGSTRGIEAPGTGTRDTPGTPAPPGRSTYFDMRRGGRVDLSLPASRDALDNVPRGTAPAAARETTGLLDNAGGGRKKSDQGVFVAKVERDGSVKLTDASSVEIELSPNPAKLLGGRFDVTDYLMRRNGEDPYASRKLKFLDDTRDERVAMGKHWRREQLQQTSEIMRKNLQRAWATTSGLAARKQALFELWDEIVEPRTRDDLADEVLVDASNAARKAVIGFIRARLPAGSELAYSDAELAEYNARRKSTQAFAPY